MSARGNVSPRPFAARPAPAGPANPVIREPEVPALGALRVLARTDGRFIVYDGEAPLGRATIAGPFHRVEEAVAAQQRIYAQRARVVVPFAGGKRP